MGIAAYPDHLSFVLFALLAPFSPFLTTIVFKKNVGGLFRKIWIFEFHCSCRFTEKVCGYPWLLLRFPTF